MKTEQSKVKLFVVLWKHVMQIQNETPILSCILCKIFKALYSTQLFKIRTLSYRDNVTGHTLVKGTRGCFHVASNNQGSDGEWDRDDFPSEGKWDDYGDI